MLRDLAFHAHQRTEDEVFMTLDPTYESELTLQLTQPLLRTAGRDFNLALVMLEEAGYETVTVFEGRKATQRRIVR